MRSPAEQQFDFWGCDFPMKLPSELQRVFPCQNWTRWHVGHVLLLLVCSSQSLSWSRLGLSVFPVLSAQRPFMRHCQKSQCTSKTGPGFARKSSGRWKKQKWSISFLLALHLGISFSNKMSLTSWMCRIWTCNFHWLSCKLHTENLCIAENIRVPDNFVTGLFLHSWH